MKGREGRNRPGGLLNREEERRLMRSEIDGDKTVVVRVQAHERVKKNYSNDEHGSSEEQNVHRSF